MFPDEIAIKPVNPANHAEELHRIVQIQKTGEDGKFNFSYRPYVPLHGMDASEARNRAYYTAQVGQIVKLIQSHGKHSPFVAPKLAAEGIFPELLDDKGQQLHFQVYRVPSTPRISSQLFSVVKSQARFENVMEFISAASYKVGITLRNFHMNGMAYMDVHVGNMSWIPGSRRKALYTADLGSIKDISQEAHSDNYRAFDFHMYSVSMGKLLKSFFDPLPQKQEAAQFIVDLVYTGTHYALKGYFRPEVKLFAKNSPQKLDGIFERHIPELTALAFTQSLDDFVVEFKKFEQLLKRGPAA